MLWRAPGNEGGAGGVRKTEDQKRTPQVPELGETARKPSGGKGATPRGRGRVRVKVVRDHSGMMTMMMMMLVYSALDAL